MIQIILTHLIIGFLFFPPWTYYCFINILQSSCFNTCNLYQLIVHFNSRVHNVTMRYSRTVAEVARTKFKLCLHKIKFKSCQLQFIIIALNTEGSIPYQKDKTYKNCLGKKLICISKLLCKHCQKVDMCYVSVTSKLTILVVETWI